MSTESNNCDEGLPVEESGMYVYAKANLQNGFRLDDDTMNVWGSLACILPRLPSSMDTVKPRRYYQEYVAEIDRSNGFEGKYVAMVMQFSDPAAVVAFDQLVDEFNADLERIKLEKDFQALKDFLEKAKELVYSKKQ